MVKLEKRKKEYPIITEPYFDFLEKILGIGKVGIMGWECALANLTLIYLSPNLEDENWQTFVSICKQLSISDRWDLLDTLTENIEATKVPKHIWNSLLLFYKQDKDKKYWETEFDKYAINLLALSYPYIDDLVKEQVISLFLEATQNKQSEVCIFALKALDKLEVPPEVKGKYYPILLKNLSDKNQYYAHEAFSILCK